MIATPKTDVEFAHFPTEGPTVAGRIEQARDFAQKLERENVRFAGLMKQVTNAREAQRCIIAEQKKTTDECKRLLSEVHKNTNLRFHPELVGLNQMVADAIG